MITDKQYIAIEMLIEKAVLNRGDLNLDDAEFINRTGHDMGMLGIMMNLTPLELERLQNIVRRFE